MAKPGILPTTQEQPEEAPARRRICMAVFSRAKSTSSFRSLLYVLVFLNMIGAFLVVTSLGAFLSNPSIIDDETPVSAETKSLLQYYAIVMVVIASFHLLMTFIPIAAEYKESPRLYSPWIGYLYFLLIMHIAGLIHTLVNYSDEDGMSDSRAGTHGIGLLLLGLTMIISRRRKAEMEEGMQHAILISS